MGTGVIVMVFPTRRALTRAVDYLKENPIVDIKRAAVVAKAQSGETVILDDDLSPHEGGIAGGALGAVMGAIGSIMSLGALTLPGVGPIIVMGAGTLVGGLLGHVTGRFAAYLLDFGYKNEDIEALAHRLEEGHPALVIHVEQLESSLKTLRDHLTRFRAELIEPLSFNQGQAPKGESPDASL